MEEPAKIGDAYEVAVSFTIDGKIIPADICIIFDRVIVCRGTALAVLIACYNNSNEDEIKFRKCQNGDIQLPYEALNHLIQSNILTLFGTNITPMDVVDMQ